MIRDLLIWNGALLTMPRTMARTGSRRRRRRGRSRGPPARRSTRGRGRARRSAASRSACVDELRRDCASSAWRSPAGPSNAVAVGQRAGRIDRRVRLRSSVRHRPIASKFSSAKPSGSIRAGSSRRPGSRGAAPSARASTAPCRASRSSLQRRHVRRRRRRRRAEEVLEDPLAAHTGEVRSGYDVTVRMLPWPSSPRARCRSAA